MLYKCSHGYPAHLIKGYDAISTLPDGNSLIITNIHKTRLSDKQNKKLNENQLDTISYLYNVVYLHIGS